MNNIDINMNAKLALYLIDNNIMTINDVIIHEIKNKILELIEERKIK